MPLTCGSVLEWRCSASEDEDARRGVEGALVSEIVLDPSWVGPMGERIRETGQHMPDPPGTAVGESGCDRVDDALRAVLGAVGDHLLGLGAGTVRLGQSAVAASDAFQASDAAAGGEP